LWAKRLPAEASAQAGSNPIDSAGVRKVYKVHKVNRQRVIISGSEGCFLPLLFSSHPERRRRVGACLLKLAAKAGDEG